MFVIIIILIVKFEFLNRFTCKLKWICDNSVLRFSPIANKINTARAEVSFLWVLVVSLTPLQFELRVTFASDALNILFHFHFTPSLLFSLGFFSIFGTTLGISVRASGPIDASSDRDSLKWVIIYHWLHFVAEVLCCWQLWQLEQLRQLSDSGQLQFALLSFFTFFFLSPQMQFGQSISISSSVDPHGTHHYQDRHRLVLSSLSSPVFVSLFFRHFTRPQSQSQSQSQSPSLFSY